MEVYFVEKYKKLAHAYETNNLVNIDYCMNFDYLHDDNEVLVKSNYKKIKLNNLLGTSENFILTNYSNTHNILNNLYV